MKLMKDYFSLFYSQETYRTDCTRKLLLFTKSHVPRVTSGLCFQATSKYEPLKSSPYFRRLNLQGVWLGLQIKCAISLSFLGFRYLDMF